MVIDPGSIFLIGLSMGILVGFVSAYMIDRVFDIYAGDDVKRLVESNRQAHETIVELNHQLASYTTSSPESQTQKDINGYPE